MKEIISKLKELKAKRVFVQFPNGLKLRIQNIAKRLEKEGFEVIICLEECFGSCDVRDAEGIRLGCNTILHIGHEQFVKQTELPVVYWEYFLDVDPLPVLEKELDKLGKYENIGIVTSIQFVKTIPVVKDYLERKGKKVFVHKSLEYPGQILGCNLNAAKAVEDKVDCFLCISAGKFYGWGLILKTEKPVFVLDLEKKEIYSLDETRRKVKKIIAWNKSKFKEAKKVGLLVSWKKGQLRKDLFEVKKKVEEKGKEVFILAMDEITPEKIEGLKLDFLVNSSCPRIGLDDLERYKIPVVNVEDLY